MVKEAYTVTPNPDVYDDYQKVFDTYVELYEELKGTMSKER